LPRAMLFEEDANDRNGKRLDGVALWTLQAGSAGPEVRASVAIAERQMVFKWTLQSNQDRTLPASHTIDMTFDLPSDFQHGGVQRVHGVLMKTAEAARGTPLRGQVVKITTGHFLLGLSNVVADRDANMQLLRERDWLDVAILYDDTRRAILAFEKGTAGKRILNDAFAAWATKSRP